MDLRGLISLWGATAYVQPGKLHMLILNIADNKLGNEACTKLTHFLEHHLTGFKVHELRLHKNCRIKCVHCGKCKHKLGMSEHVAFCSNTRFSAQLVARPVPKNGHVQSIPRMAVNRSDPRKTTREPSLDLSSTTSTTTLHGKVEK